MKIVLVRNSHEALSAAAASNENPYTAILLATLISLGFVGIVMVCFWVADKMRK